MFNALTNTLLWYVPGTSNEAKFNHHSPSNFSVNNSNTGATSYTTDPFLIALTQTSSYLYPDMEYLFNDHLGSMRMIYKLNYNCAGVFQNTTIQYMADYFSFGKIVREYINPGTIAEKYKYTGKERDTESGYDYFSARNYHSEVGRFLSVDPLAHKMPGWSPYGYGFNNPIRMVDPDGREPEDWIKKPNGQIVFNASVTNQSQATATYGQGAENLGASGLLMNDNGDQISLNADGTASNNVLLNEVTVTGQKTDGGFLGTADGAVNAIGGAIDSQTGLTIGAGKLSGLSNDIVPVVKGLDAVAGALGWTGAAISIGQANDNPSAGNILNAGLDLGLSALKLTPGVGAAVGLVDFALTVSGAKDAMFNAVDNGVDRFQANQVLKADQVDISKIRLK